MFDSLTAASLADQLTTDILDGRVQNVGLLSHRAIVLEVYANHRRSYLVASAENQSPSVYLTRDEPVLDRQLVTPLVLLLRKYVRGSRLVGIQQPPLERQLSLTFASPLIRGTDLVVTNEDDEDEESEDNVIFTHVHLEIMGRHSNIIMVGDDGAIMESVKRVSPQMSRVRPIMPRRPYIPPPARDLADPRRATEAEIRALITPGSTDKEMVRTLTGNYRGISPQIAREVVYRTRHNTSDADPTSMAQHLRHVLEPLITSHWTPVLYLDQSDAVVAYSPVRLESLRADCREQVAESISAAIEGFDGGIGTVSEAGKHYVRSQRLANSIRQALDRVEAQSGALDVQELRHQDREQYRMWGETIFGYMWQIKPGDTELVVDDLVVPLDPALGPAEQARAYLEQYTRGKSSEVHIQNVRDGIESRRAYLDQLLFLAAQARTIQDIEELESEWFAAQPEQNPGKSPKRSTGRKRTLPTLILRDQSIYVGHSGAENDRVTFDIAGPEDTWLHARGVPGSHVIVKWTPGVHDLDEVLLRAAEIAAFFSQSRQNGRVEVDITLRKHVRKIKGGGPGMVTYRNERTVSVSPVGPV